MKNMKKYIAYYRVSTNKQSLGLDAQRNSVLSYLNNDNTNILISEFVEKESGKNNNRIQLSNAITECKKQNAILIIAKLDRLSRNVGFIFNLKESGVDFFALDIPNFSTLTLGIFSTIAQSERETISQRTKVALEAKKKNGFKLGAPNAQFTNEMREKAILINKEKAYNNENNKRAKAMIEILLKNTSNFSKIARTLNENGFVTSRGKQFDCKSVKLIIARYNLTA